MTILSLCALAFAFVCIFILAPISLYYLLRHYHLRHNVIIEKRHWKLTVFQISCTVLSLLIERPLALFITVYYSQATVLFILYLIDKLLHVILLHTNSFLILLRFWVCHYDICHISAQNKKYWHGLIEKGLSILHTNFYLVHRSTFGNLSYLKRISIIILTCTIPVSSAVFTIAYFYYDRPTCDVLYFAMNSIIVFVPTSCLIAIIWHRTISFHGVLGIESEMRIIAYCTVIGFVLYILWSITCVTLFKTAASEWIELMDIAIFGFLYFAINLFPMIYLHHFSKQSKLLNAEGNKVSKKVIRLRSGSLDHHESPRISMTLNSILSSLIGYGLTFYYWHLSLCTF